MNEHNIRLLVPPTCSYCALLVEVFSSACGVPVPVPIPILDGFGAVYGKMTQNKDMKKLSGVYSERGVPLPV